MGKEIDKIREEMQDEGVIKENTIKSWQWLAKNIEELTEGKETKLIQEMRRSSDPRIMPRIGKLYMFSYLAKHRKTLPYYDYFPVILVLNINLKEEYMLGINLHYLPLPLRAKLFKSILPFLNNKRWDDSTKFKVTWDVCMALSTSPLFVPTIKRYNFEQLRSRFIIVEEEEWDIVTMLPTHIFKKATTQEVWADSIQEIRIAAGKNRLPTRKNKVPTRKKKVRNGKR